MHPVALVLVLIGFPLLATVWTLKAGPEGPWRGRFTTAAALLGVATVLVLGADNAAFGLLVGGVGIALLVLALQARTKALDESRSARNA